MTPTEKRLRALRDELICWMFDAHTTKAQEKMAQIRKEIERLEKKHKK